jgi:crotonobetainyl-CoA:carnitine CoA-transferase CaiB-like acyl-CoA transferase
MSMPLPLAGVRVLAFSQFGAGPFATLNLADMGAEVIKIEDPTTGGEISRFVPPHRIDGDSLYFQSWNRGKRSITLNLRKPGARDILHDLVRVSDAVFNNLRGDEPAKLGLTYSSLGQVNPRIVCCSLNGFGSTGPRAADPGYDYLMQASTGYMSMTGDPASPPAASGVSFVDHAAGFAAALGLVSSLYAARVSGRGRDVEVSLLNTAYSMLTYLAIWNLNKGFEPKRHPGSAHQTLVPVQTFRTADGHITIFCGKEKFWQSLCQAFGDPELASDSRFDTFERRLSNRAECVEAVQSHFLKRTTGDWIDQLSGKVPCAPVRSLSDALEAASDDPETIVEVDHPEFGVLREVNTLVRFAERNGNRRARAPRLGEHTDIVLRDCLNYSDEKIAELRKQLIL